MLLPCHQMIKKTKHVNCIASIEPEMRKKIDFMTYFGRFFFLSTWNICDKKKDDNIIFQGLFQTLLYGGGQKEVWPHSENRVDHMILLKWSNFFVCHHFVKFKTTPFLLGLFHKQCQTLAVLISFLYIAAKHTEMMLVLPTIKHTIIRYFKSWRASKLHLWFKSYGHFA